MDATGAVGTALVVATAVEHFCTLTGKLHILKGVVGDAHLVYWTNKGEPVKWCPFCGDELPDHA